jgi:hypothetical protein
MSVPRNHGGQFTHQDIIEEQMKSCGGILKQTSRLAACEIIEKEGRAEPAKEKK